MKYFSRRHCVDAETLPRITTTRKRIAQAAVRCARCGSERQLHKVMRPHGLMACVLHCEKCNVAKQVYVKQVLPRG